MPSSDSTQLPKQPVAPNTAATPAATPPAAYVTQPAPVQAAQPVQPVAPGTPVVPAQPVVPVEPVVPALVTPTVDSALPPLPPRVLAVPTEPVAPTALGTPVQFVTPVATTPAAARVFNLRRVLYTLLSILEVFLAIRLLLRLLAANPDAVFSRLIYALTFPFIAPFSGVFPDSRASGSVLELSTILAMIMYPLFCWIVVRVVRLTNRRRLTTPTTT
jgi:hypothetical protein